MNHLLELFKRKSCQGLVAIEYDEKEMSMMTARFLCCETCGWLYFSLK